jgi:hypothetical protein
MLYSIDRTQPLIINPSILWLCRVVRDPPGPPSSSSSFSHLSTREQEPTTGQHRGVTRPTHEFLHVLVDEFPRPMESLGSLHDVGRGTADEGSTHAQPERPEPVESPHVGGAVPRHRRGVT